MRRSIFALTQLRLLAAMKREIGAQSSIKDESSAERLSKEVTYSLLDSFILEKNMNRVFWSINQSVERPDDTGFVFRRIQIREPFID
jgi:hypothetical protein